MYLFNVDKKILKFENTPLEISGFSTIKKSGRKSTKFFKFFNQHSKWSKSDRTVENFDPFFNGS